MFFKETISLKVANGSILDPSDTTNLMDVDQAVENGFVNPNTQVSLSRAMTIADAEEPTLFDFIKRLKKGEHPHLGTDYKIIKGYAKKNSMIGKKNG